jgi:tetratricopeptide (TPR) repeat protein
MKILIIYIVLVLSSLTVFWQVNEFDFVNLDDTTYITSNSHIQSGITWKELRWAFSTTHGEYWHPVTWLSLMLDYHFFGLNAGGYHIINLILHILSTLLLFWLFNRITGTIWQSAFVAAVFALHPLHVECVAWIAKRRDILSAFFGILTLCLYVYYTEKPLLKKYALIFFPFVLALMSKPMVITLPVIMVLLDYRPLNRFQSVQGNFILWQLREKSPFLILAGLFSLVTIYARDDTFMTHFPLTSRISNAVISFVTYLGKTFYPHDLIVLQLFPLHIPLWNMLFSTILIIFVSLAVILTLKYSPYLLVGWLWYTITILPMLGIIQYGHLSMSDHHTYFPLIGITIMMAWGIPLLFPSENSRKKILFPAGIAAITILAVLTWRQCNYWKNSITLFSHTLQITNNNYIAHNYLGSEFLKNKDFKKAIAHYNDAIRLKPDMVNYYGDRANAYFQIGQYYRALEDYSKAIQLRPLEGQYYSNRGNAYVKLGQYKPAMDDFNKAIRISPDLAELYYNRGTSYAEFGYYQGAIEDFNKAIRLKPDYVDAYFNKGTVYAKLLQYQKAIEEFNKAIILNPYYVAAYHSRGVAYLLQGNHDGGCRDAEKICAWGNCQLLEFAKRKGYCR